MNLFFCLLWQSYGAARARALAQGHFGNDGATAWLQSPSTKRGDPPPPPPVQQWSRFCAHLYVVARRSCQTMSSTGAPKRRTRHRLSAGELKPPVTDQRRKKRQKLVSLRSVAAGLGEELPRNYALPTEPRIRCELRRTGLKRGDKSALSPAHTLVPTTSHSLSRIKRAVNFTCV